MEKVSYLNRWDLRQYYRDDFCFVDHNPPFTDLESVLIAIVIYLIAIRLSTWYMESLEKPYKLYWISLFHNFFIFALSVIMFLSISYHIINIINEDGLEAVTWDSKRKYRNHLVNFWEYIFYISKPYEFVDTFIMIFKKKKLNFLHVWHHCSTFFLVWVNMYDDMRIQWVCMVFNSLVHSFMYYYYLVSSFGYQPWWKRYLTQFQIAQFIITTIVNSTWVWAWYSGKNPVGSWRAFNSALFIIGSFLILFINFYIQSYKKPKQGSIKKE